MIRRRIDAAAHQHPGPAEYLIDTVAVDERPRAQDLLLRRCGRKPDIFWTPLEDLDLEKGAAPKALPIAGGKTYSENAARDFVAAAPFASLAAPES